MAANASSSGIDLNVVGGMGTFIGTAILALLTVIVAIVALIEFLMRTRLQEHQVELVVTGNSRFSREMSLQLQNCGKQHIRVKSMELWPRDAHRVFCAFVEKFALVGEASDSDPAWGEATELLQILQLLRLRSADKNDRLLARRIARCELARIPEGSKSYWCDVVVRNRIGKQRIHWDEDIHGDSILHEPFPLFLEAMSPHAANAVEVTRFVDHVEPESLVMLWGLKKEDFSRTVKREHHLHPLRKADDSESGEGSKMLSESELQEHIEEMWDRMMRAFCIFCDNTLLILDVEAADCCGTSRRRRVVLPLNGTVYGSHRRMHHDNNISNRATWERWRIESIDNRDTNPSLVAGCNDVENSKNALLEPDSRIEKILDPKGSIQTTNNKDYDFEGLTIEI